MFSWEDMGCPTRPTQLAKGPTGKFSGTSRGVLLRMRYGMSHLILGGGRWGVPLGCSHKRVCGMSHPSRVGHPT
jgi:hypothetical protein